MFSGTFLRFFLTILFFPTEKTCVDFIITMQILPKFSFSFRPLSILITILVTYKIYQIKILYYRCTTRDISKTETKISLQSHCLLQVCTSGLVQVMGFLEVLVQLQEWKQVKVRKYWPPFLSDKEFCSVQTLVLTKQIMPVSKWRDNVLMRITHSQKAHSPNAETVLLGFSIRD